jgi:hypothetical protein
LVFLTGFFLAGFLAAVDFGFAFSVLVFLVAVFFAGAFSDFSIALVSFHLFSQFLELFLQRFQVLFNDHSFLLPR